MSGFQIGENTFHLNRWVSFFVFANLKDGNSKFHNHNITRTSNPFVEVIVPSLLTENKRDFPEVKHRNIRFKRFQEVSFVSDGLVEGKP